MVLGARISPAPPRGPCTGPDMLTFGIEEPDGTFAELGSLDGRHLSTEVAGGFTGRIIGMYASAGTVPFDCCDYALLGP